MISQKMKNVPWRQFVGALFTTELGSDHHPLKSCMYDVYEGSGRPYYQNPSKTTEVNEFMAEEICLSFAFFWKNLKSIDPPKND